MALNTREESCRGVDGKVLDSLWKLVDDDSKIRVKNGAWIVKYFLQKPAPKKDVSYIMDRLVRGLSSIRKKARHGFYITLVELLRVVTEIQVEEVIHAINTNLRDSQCAKLLELLIGQVLAYGALIRSEKLLTADAITVSNVTKSLFLSGKHRIYLSFMAATFFTEFLGKVSEDVFQDSIWPWLESEMAISWEKHSLDTLWVLKIANKRFPAVVKKSFLNKNLGATKVFHVDNFKSLKEFLMKITHVTDCHPLYEEMIQDIISTNHLELFSRKIFDPFLMKATKPQYCLILILIRTIFRVAEDKDQIVCILTPNLLTVLSQSSKHRNPHLQQISKEILTSLITVMGDPRTTAETQRKVFKKLLQPPGNIRFDIVTGTTTIHQMLAVAKPDAVKTLSKLYKKCILATGKERTFSIQQLAKLVNLPQMDSEVTWKINQLKFLLNCGFFVIHKPIKSLKTLPQPMKQTTVTELGKNFYFALNLRHKDLKDLCKVLCAVVHHANDLLKTPDTAEPLKKLNKKSAAAWTAMVKKVKQLEDNKQEQDGLWKRQVFQVLFYNMGLLLFSEPHIAQDILSDLHICYEKSQKKEVKSEDSLGEKEQNEEPVWLEVVMDLLLSLLSKKSNPLHVVVEKVFLLLCPHITTRELKQILDVIDPNKKEASLMVDDDEMLEEEDEDGVEDSESEGEEVDSSDIEENEGSSDEDSAVDDSFREEVQTALHKAAFSDTESIDLDELDEEEAKRLDESLASVFRTLQTTKKAKKKKKEQSESEIQLTQIRIRCLHFLEIYLNSKPPMVLALQMILPLVAALQFSIKDKEQKPLEDKVRFCLKKLTSIKYFSNTEGMSEEDLNKQLRVLINQSEKNSVLIPEMGDILADCCTLVLRCVLNLQATKNNVMSTDECSETYNIYNAALSRFFKKRDCMLRMSLFTRILQLSWKEAWKFGDLLLAYAFQQQTVMFQCSQALKLLTILFQNNMLQTRIDEDDRLKFKKKLSENILQNLKSNHQTHHLKVEHICQLLTLLKAVRISEKTSKQDGGMEWEKIWKALQHFRQEHSSKFSSELKHSYSKLGQLLDFQMDQRTLQESKNRIKNEEVETEKKELSVTEISPVKKKRRKDELKTQANDTCSVDTATEAVMKADKKRERKKKDIKGTRVKQLEALSKDTSGVSFSDADLNENITELKEKEAENVAHSEAKEKLEKTTDKLELTFDKIQDSLNGDCLMKVKNILNSKVTDKKRKSNLTSKNPTLIRRKEVSDNETYTSEEIPERKRKKKKLDNFGFVNGILSDDIE